MKTISRSVQPGLRRYGAAARKAGADNDLRQCDYAICGDQDEYLKKHPEYMDEQGYRRNRE